MDILSLLSAIAAAVGALLLKLISSEIGDWIPALARRIVRYAVFQLPQRERERYREEWLSHLEECPGKLGKLFHSVGCCVGARRLGRALCKAPVANVEISETPAHAVTHVAECERIPERDILAMIAMLDYLIVEVSKIDTTSVETLVEACTSLRSLTAIPTKKKPKDDK